MYKTMCNVPYTPLLSGRNYSAFQLVFTVSIHIFAYNLAYQLSFIFYDNNTDKDTRKHALRGRIEQLFINSSRIAWLIN